MAITELHDPMILFRIHKIKLRTQKMQKKSKYIYVISGSRMDVWAHESTTHQVRMDIEKTTYQQVIYPVGLAWCN